VSSTRVREAVKREDWEEVKQLVGEETGVEAWVRERGLYAEDKEKERL
jgi:FAD synthase